MGTGHVLTRRAILVAAAFASLVVAGPSAAQQPPHELREGSFVVAYWPGHEELARRLLDLAPGLARLPALPPEALLGGEPVRIELAPDTTRLRELTGGGLPEWGAGAAIPAESRIVLPVSSGRPRDARALATVLRHELAHIALHRHLAPARPPRWFDEGYARWAAGEWGWESAWELRLAFALDRTPPLDSIALAWPASAADARVAYFLATTAVVYLVRRSGERGLAALLERWRDGATLDEAMRATYGMTVAQFEVYWRREVGRSYGWALAFSHSLAFWAAAGGLLVLLYRARRRRNDARLEGLRAAELPDAPAYWIPDPAPAAPASGGPPSGESSSGESSSLVESWPRVSAPPGGTGEGPPR